MKYLFFLFTLFTALTVQGGNKVLSPRFKSLTSVVNGDWLNRPVMTLGTSDVLQIGFDELSHNYHRLVYHLDHCENDWTVSDGLFESDWLEGFNDNPIDDYQNSINTTVPYTHYDLQLPNDRCRLKMSGNYRLTISDEDEGNEEVMVVEFYVVEPLMDVALYASTNTDIDHNQQHQQVSMSVSYNDLRITNTDEQIYTVVMQNWREDNARRNVRPDMQTMRGLEWSHNKQLIFPAGNEYHKFEVLDVSHPTMGIEHIEWDGHYYQAYPFVSTVRRNYLTDVDADGAFCIRNSDRREDAYTCDYVWVNYQLQAPYQGNLYIAGHWTINEPRETYQMQHDGNQGYYARILQKQGYYSYQYLCADGSQPPSEGNFFQTENKYQTLIYYKGVGERTWRLVGYRAIELR
jgi:hypothetical protein